MIWIPSRFISSDGRPRENLWRCPLFMFFGAWAQVFDTPLFIFGCFCFPSLPSPISNEIRSRSRYTPIIACRRARQPFILTLNHSISINRALKRYLLGKISRFDIGNSEISGCAPRLPSTLVAVAAQGGRRQFYQGQHP